MCRVYDDGHDPVGFEMRVAPESRVARALLTASAMRASRGLHFLTGVWLLASLGCSGSIAGSPHGAATDANGAIAATDASSPMTTMDASRSTAQTTAANGSSAGGPGSGDAMAGTPGDAVAMTMNPNESNEASAVMIWTGDADVGGICGVGDAATGDAGDGGGPSWCGCTRRPDAQESFQCPRGVGELATANIGASGGSVELTGHQGIVSGVSAKVDFPPTALASPLEITLIETAIPPPQDLIDWSPVYRLEPLGAALATAAAVRLPWSNSVANVPGLSVWASPDGTCFTRMPSSA